jgi:hypothetical protein
VGYVHVTRVCVVGQAVYEIWPTVFVFAIDAVICFPFLCVSFFLMVCYAFAADKRVRIFIKNQVLS